MSEQSPEQSPNGNPFGEVIAMMRTSSHPFDDLIRFQAEHEVWERHNFGEVPWWQPALGVSEEVGELHHALLKAEQGIRGSAEDHDAAAQDAVGDVVVYLTALCTARGWSLADILRDTWAEVQARDWKTNATDGSTDE